VLPALLEERRSDLAELCRRHHVSRLELFGSAASGGFDPAHSDLDFLVEFEDLTPIEYARSYFGLLHDLEDLFERPIDLVTVRSLTNPYLLRAIERDRTVLYAA
jgi:predicted nucleotidyltransferase